MKVSRILHAGYLFESEGVRIAFDPIFENPFSVNCRAFPDVAFDVARIRELKLDAVFLSHHHDDHFSLESLNLLRRETPIYFYCIHEKLFELIRELGFENVRSLELDRSVDVGPFEVIARRAADADVDSLFQVRAEGLNVLNVVDSWIDEETMPLLETFAPWDLVLWPFQTMRETDVIAPSCAIPPSETLPSEWIDQLRRLRPRFVVPSSCQFKHEEWSWYNRAMFPVSYRRFDAEARAALDGVSVIRLDPSVSVILTKSGLEPSAALEWIRPIGRQDVDYEFDAGVSIPSTAEIARRFPPLTSERALAVEDFCRTELPRRFAVLGPPEEPFFRKKRRWRLLLWNHLGEKTTFDYSADDDRLEAIDVRGEADWLTEVPSAKLFNALFEGESLTSMYVRVEPGNPSADVLDDPLIRCLFNGRVGAYQEAQLRRLREKSFRA